MTEQPSPISSLPPQIAVWPDWQKQIVAMVLLFIVPIVLYFLQPVLAPLLLTLAIAFILMYPIRWLQRLNLSYNIAAIIVYIIFLVISAGAIVWFISSAISGILETIQTAQTFVQSLIVGQVVQDPFNLKWMHDAFKTFTVINAGVTLLTTPAEFFTVIMERLSRLSRFVSTYSFVTILLLFFLLEWPRTVQIVSTRFPENSRRDYAILMKRIVALSESYLLGTLLIVLFYWALTALLFWLSGVPNPIILGLIVAIPNFIPQAGGLVSAVAVFVLTVVTGSDTFVINRLLFAFIQMAIFMLLSGVAYYFVDARIYSKSVNVPVWIILVGLMVFGTFMGVIGLFIAAAAVAIMGELLDFVLKKLQGLEPYPILPELPTPPLPESIDIDNSAV